MANYIKSKMEWRRMKRIAFDHPYYDDKGHRLSERGVAALLRGCNIPTGREVLREARIQLNLPEFAEKATEYGRGALSSKKVLWLTAALAALLLLTGFFTLTPTGTALAEEIRSIIVNVFNGTLQARQSKPDDVASIDFSALPNEFSSLNEIAQLTQRELFAPGEDSSQTSLFVDKIEPEMLVIQARYEWESGETYTITQVLYNRDTMWAASVSAAYCENITLSSGLTLYLGEMEDGTVFAEMYRNGHDLSVTSTEMTMDELRQAANSLHPVS